jgi:hypothetical protein
MQRDAARLARLPRVQTGLWVNMAYARGTYGTRFISMTPKALGLLTLYDSVANYFDTKADVLVARGDELGARAYYDSIRTRLAAVPAEQVFALNVPGYRALAEAALGDTATARRTLSSLLVSARQIASRADLTDVLDARIMAGIYGRLDEPEEAVRWLEAGLRAPVSFTARGYANEPKTHVLRGTPAFERFLRAHPE